jgi:hypothetical protein
MIAFETWYICTERDCGFLHACIRSASTSQPITVAHALDIMVQWCLRARKCCFKSNIRMAIDHGSNSPLNLWHICHYSEGT